MSRRAIVLDARDLPRPNRSAEISLTADRFSLALGQPSGLDGHVVGREVDRIVQGMLAGEMARWESLMQPRPVVSRADWDI